MAEYLDSIVNLILVFAIGLVSPGPDFALIVKNSLTYSRKTAIYTALGIALGATTHSSYILLGLGSLITNNPLALNMLTIFGSIYLIYLGILGIKSKKRSGIKEFEHINDISAQAAISSGYMTCLLNPKAIFFLTSLLTTVSISHPPKPLMFLFGATIFLETLLWYCFVSIFLTAKNTRKKIASVEHWVNRITGSFLVLIGIKLLYQVIRKYA